MKVLIVIDMQKGFINSNKYEKFNKKGFYTIYIRPKEISHTITDVSVLAAYPDVRGIVLRKNVSLM